MPGKISMPLIKPMLAVRSKPFDDDEFLFEVKWDGYRALAYLEDGATKLRSRNLLDITHIFPELSKMHLNVKRLPALMDGEVVVFSGGKPSFGAIQARGTLADPYKIRRASANNPALYLAFDILYLSGKPLLDEILLRRKEMLMESVCSGSFLAVPDFIVGRGVMFAEAARGKGLEGVMAKAVESPYLPGKRSTYWRKIRHTKEADLVICGYSEGKGERILGSLALCRYAGERAEYTGRVGVGFSRKAEEDILKRLKKMRAVSPPVSVPPGEAGGVVWVYPELVCTVEYLERTGEGLLRHPVFKGLRFDKAAQECDLPE